MIYRFKKTNMILDPEIGKAYLIENYHGDEAIARVEDISENNVPSGWNKAYKLRFNDESIAWVFDSDIPTHIRFAREYSFFINLENELV